VLISRPSHGVHGNHRFLQQEEEVPISRFISGHLPLVLEPPRYVPLRKSPRFSGLHIRKNCSRHTDSQTTTYQSGHIHLWKRSTMSQHTTVEYCAVPSVLMGLRWLLVLVMRISSFGRFGKQRRARRLARRRRMEWEGVRIRSGLDRSFGWYMGDRLSRRDCILLSYICVDSWRHV
jgi:hypothetical protein